MLEERTGEIVSADDVKAVSSEDEIYQQGGEVLMSAMPGEPGGEPPGGDPDLPLFYVPGVMRVGVPVSSVSRGCWGRRSVAEPVPAAVSPFAPLAAAANVAGVT